MKRFFLILFLLITATSSFAQDYSLFEKYKFIQNGDTLPYRILFPENFDAKKFYPIVLFLHGRGESGNDNEKQLLHGAKLFLDKNNRQQFPAIIVFPQNPVNSYWSNVQMIADNEGHRTFYFVNGGEASTSMKMVISLMYNLFTRYKINKEQIYVMGLSMGGMGTFEIVNRMPNTFAAAIPICGGANPLTAANIKNTNWWIFHGAKDDVVLPKYSEQMVKALKEKGAKVKFTLYPQANHNSWDSTFNEPDLLKWLFTQKNIYFKKVKKMIVN